MNEVCVVIDLEGFHTKGTRAFKYRELGYCDWQGNKSGSYRYRLPDSFKDLSRQEKRGVRYVTENVHGLPYDATEKEGAKDVEQIREDVLDIYRRFKTEDKTLVGYKGGHVEKDLLEELSIPFHDLELDRCPPFRVLKRIKGARGCGNHGDSTHNHCAELECVHFVEWMKQQLKDSASR